VEFILGVEFRVLPGVYVRQYPFTRKGFKKMCYQIHQTMKLGAHTVTIADGNVVAKFVDIEAWLDLSPLELRNRIDRVISDVTLKKVEIERANRAAA